MAETDDTTKALPGKPQQALGQLIEAQRAKLLQAHAIMICVREVLLYAEGDDAVIYAEAANAAAMLANDAVEELDCVRLKPMLDALRLERADGVGAPAGSELRRGRRRLDVAAQRQQPRKVPPTREGLPSRRLKRVIDFDSLRSGG